MDNSIAKAIVRLKNEFAQSYKRRSHLHEVIPLSHLKHLPIDDHVLQSLHKFAASNPIYFRSYEAEISGVACRVYEGDINNYWLGSKKHDTSYQPFYPTWILSAYALVLATKALGFRELVDVGSGDGRIAYCAKLLRLESHSIEIDGGLTELQRAVSSATGIKYNLINADATRFDYATLNLSRPIFFISGLPEMGEMLANSVIGKIMTIKELKLTSGFTFMGSHAMKPLSRDQTKWGWGAVIASFSLELVGTITLPTHWTTDQSADTPYVYTKCRDR